ncbi:MAG: SulP family inorganic anion transporter [Gaiellaceae bacterium]
MSEQGRTGRVLASITAGLVIGLFEAVLAISLAALMFGGYLAQLLADGIGLYLVAAAATLAILSWRAGTRGVVGGLQEAVAAVLAVVATRTVQTTFGGSNLAFVTVIAATMVVTILTGLTLLLIGAFKRGNLIRFVPYPVVGGFLAGAGWLLLRGGVFVASGEEVHLGTIGALVGAQTLEHWLPALAFGVLLLLAVRLVKRPLVIPVVLAVGLALFAAGMLATGSSLEDARNGFWLIGPYRGGWLFQPWTFRALAGADWWAVLEQAAGIATVVLVAVIGVLFHISGHEIVLHRDLDTNRELREAGLLNIVSGAVGGTPGYHALGLTALAQRMNVDARAAGLIASLVPLSALLFGAAAIELIPRMLIGGLAGF